MPHTNSRWTWILVVLVFLSVTCSAQPAIDSQELTPGKPIEREPSSSEAHLYTNQLNAGRFLELAVNQRGTDVEQESLSPEQASEMIKQGDQAFAEGDYPRAVAGRAKDAAERIGDDAALAEALGKLGNILRLVITLKL